MIACIYRQRKFFILRFVNICKYCLRLILSLLVRNNARHDIILGAQNLRSGRTTAQNGALAATHQHHHADRSRRPAGDSRRPSRPRAHQHHNRHIQPLPEKLGQDSGGKDWGTVRIKAKRGGGHMVIALHCILIRIIV